MSKRTKLFLFLTFTLVASIFVSRPAAAKDDAYATFDDWWWSEGFCYWHDEWSDQTPTMDQRPDTFYPGYSVRPPADVDCWLTWAHPDIGNTVVWRTGPGPGVAYPNWTWEQKAQLMQAFEHYWNWFELGYPAGWGDPFPIDTLHGSEVPVNLASPTDVDTIISPQDAWNYFIDSVALGLAAQLGHWYPWDIRWGIQIFNWDLKYLFDSDQMFAANFWDLSTLSYRVITSDTFVAEWPIHGAATLTSPLGSLELLMRQQGLVRNSMEGTLYAALDWGRDNLVHFNGPLERYSEDRVWQYGGAPPVSRVIAGTIAFEDGQGWGDHEWGVQNYTMGCHGTSGFYKAVLRTVNIPVEVVNNAYHSGMSFPMWPPWAIAGYLTHSDSIYSRAFRDQNLGLPFENPTASPESTANIIADDSDYLVWFDPSLSFHQKIANVTLSELRYLAFWQPVPTTYIMQLYCADLAAGLSHADGSVYKNLFFNQLVGLHPTGLTLQDLENASYWDWLEWRRSTYPGGCSAFQ